MVLTYGEALADRIVSCRIMYRDILCDIVSIVFSYGRVMPSLIDRSTVCDVAAY